MACPTSHSINQVHYSNACAFSRAYTASGRVFLLYMGPFRTKRVLRKNSSQGAVHGEEAPGGPGPPTIESLMSLIIILDLLQTMTSDKSLILGLHFPLPKMGEGVK